MKKAVILTLTLLITIHFGPLLAQSNRSQKEISVSVEVENGVKNTIVSVKSPEGSTTELTWQGDEIPADIKEQLDALKIDLETIEKEGKTTTVEQTIVQEKPANEHTKEIQVVIKTKDGEKVKEYKSTDEMPADIQEKVEHLEQMHTDNTDGNKVVIKTGNGEEKVFEWTGDEIPADILQDLKELDIDVLQDLKIEESPSDQAALGISMAMTVEKNIENNVETTMKRLEVAEVLAGSGAEKAGLESGDEILSVNQIPVSEPDQVVEIIAASKIGDSIPVMVKRGDRELTLNVTLQPATGATQTKKKTIVVEKDINDQH